MIGLNRSFSEPVCWMLALLICVTSAASTTAGEKTVSVADVTDVDRVHLALVTVANAVSNPVAVNLHCFRSLLPDAGRAEGVDQIQLVAAQFANLKDSISPLMLGHIEFRNVGLSGTRPNLLATADLRCDVDGHPVVIPVRVNLLMDRAFTRIVNLSDLLGDIGTLVRESASLGASLNNSGWPPGGNQTRPQRSTASPNLIRPKNLTDDHGRFNSIVSHSEFDGVDLFSRPCGVLSMWWDDWGDELDREFCLVSDANWDRIIVSSNAPENDDWLTDFGAHGDGPGYFACPAGIAFIPAQLYIVADTYNNRAVVYEVTDWENGLFEYRFEKSMPGNVADVAAAYVPRTEPLLDFAVLDRDHCNIRIYTYNGDHKQSLLSCGSGVDQLENPTSLCYGRNKNTGYSINYLYVVDDGNKRVVGKGLEVPHTFFSTEGYVTFPDDAYLTAIDADYFGYLYVLDSHHGTIYKIDPSLTELVATFGSLGVIDGALYYPQRLSLATGWYSPESLEDPIVPLNVGDLLITERWGDHTGVRRFVQGTDVLSHSVEYQPMWEEGSEDYVRCRWYQTGASRNRGSLYHSTTGIHLASFPLTEVQLPGDHYFDCDISQFGFDHCWFRFEVEVDAGAVYTGSNIVTFVDSIYVDRYVDTTCWAIFPDTACATRGSQCPYLCFSSRTPYNPDVCLHYDALNRWYWVQAWVDPQHYCIPPESVLYAQWLPSDLVGPFYPDTLGSNGQWELLTQGLRAYFKMDGNAPWDLIPGAQAPLGTIAIAASWDTTEGLWFTDTLEMTAKLYPDFCATPCTTCTPPPDPGCPMLYSWDGSEFVLENNLLPQSEESDRPLEDFTDVYLLDFAEVDQSQKYRFQVIEDESGQSQFRRFRVAALDVPQKTDKLILDNRHTLGALTGSGISPTSAITHDGQDVLAALAEADSVVFSADEPGYVDLVYPVGSRRSDRMSLSRGSGGGPDPPPPGKIPRRVTSDGEGRAGPNVFIILARNTRGDYEVVGKRHPRRRALRRPIDLSYYVIDNVVHARLAWTRRIELDHLPYFTYERLDVRPQPLPLIEAVHSDSGDVLTQLSGIGGGSVCLQPGQHLNLIYQAPPLVDSLKRVLLFRAVGRYDSYVTPGEKLAETLPVSFSFSQNYPNPFNPNTMFSFSLPRATRVTLSVYNVLGQKVATVVNQSYQAGHHVYNWDGCDSRGQPLSSGVCFARLIAGEYSSTKKMAVVK